MRLRHYCDRSQNEKKNYATCAVAPRLCCAALLQHRLLSGDLCPFPICAAGISLLNRDAAARCLRGPEPIEAWQIDAAMTSAVEALACSQRALTAFDLHPRSAVQYPDLRSFIAAAAPPDPAGQARWYCIRALKRSQDQAQHHAARLNTSRQPGPGQHAATRIVAGSWNKWGHLCRDCTAWWPTVQHANWPQPPPIEGGQRHGNRKGGFPSNHVHINRSQSPMDGQWRS